MAPRKKGGLGRGLDALIAPPAASDDKNKNKPKSSDRKKKVSREAPAQESSFIQDPSSETSDQQPKIVEKIVEVPVEKIVEKIVEKPVEKIVEVPVEKIVEKRVEVPVSDGSPIQLRIDEIEPNQDQPRKDFNEDSLLELADSIKTHGMIQPLVVSRENDYYKIIAGERRWRAARIAGLQEIPAYIKEYSPQESVEIALIENIQREDLNPIEEAQAFQRLIEEYGLSQEEAAKRVSKSRSAITNSLRLLKLDPRVRQMLIDNMISSGHARALLAVQEPEQQYQLAMRIFDNKLSVRETEKAIRHLHEKPSAPLLPTDTQMTSVYKEVEEKMTSALGSKTSIHPRTRKKGRIEIEYYSDEDLDRIVTLLINVSRETL